MNNVKKFEGYAPNLELNNEVKHHLSQFPYLSYSVKDLDDGLELSFEKGLKPKYVIGLLDPYKVKVLVKEPLKLKLTGKKKIDKFQDFQGKTVIGNIEQINFPQFNMKQIPSKIDSGATTSSIHVSYLKKDLKNKKVTFILLDERFDAYTGKQITLPLDSTIRVQSSNGEDEARPMIKLDIELKGKLLETYFTLTDREELEYPILIGKDILSGNFIIDAAQIN